MPADRRQVGKDPINKVRLSFNRVLDIGELFIESFSEIDNGIVECDYFSSNDVA